MTTDQKLAHSLKLQFGLAPTEPTEQQLAVIKEAIGRIVRAGRQPTSADWKQAVLSVCPKAGSYKYGGLDNSDLNTLLALAANAAKGG